ncbi:MAG: hypothetical protein ACRENI_06850 [Gemmatimonadaceae bacterium]
MLTRLIRLSLPALFLSLLLSPIAIVRPLHAQGLDPQCSQGSVQLEDACQKAIDLFEFLAPQLGATLAGGKALIGARSSTGRLPSFSIDLRATALTASIPQFTVDTPSTEGAVRTDYGIDRQVIALPVATASVGVFPGITIAGQRVLGVAALVSLAYLPDITTNDITLRVRESSLAWGFGARVGVLAESALIPAVSISWLSRSLPVSDIQGTTSEQDTITLGRLDATARSWRVVASKHLGPIGVAAGFGGDSYETDAELSVVINRPGFSASGTPFAFDQQMSRGNIFIELSTTLGPVVLGAAAGLVTEGDTVPTFNAFSDEQPGDARGYGSLGFGLAW